MESAIERQETNGARMLGFHSYVANGVAEYEIGLWWWILLISVRHAARG